MSGIRDRTETHDFCSRNVPLEDVLQAKEADVCFFARIPEGWGSKIVNDDDTAKVNLGRQKRY